MTARQGAMKPDLRPEVGLFALGGSMKQVTQRRSARWTKISPPARSAGAQDPPRTPRPELERNPVRPALGPYESAYDVRHGYGYDRSIVIP
jgi:hypothetical protein